jgi:hypothetical protein
MRCASNSVAKQRSLILLGCLVSASVSMNGKIARAVVRRSDDRCMRVGHPKGVPLLAVRASGRGEPTPRAPTVGAGVIGQTAVLNGASTATTVSLALENPAEKDPDRLSSLVHCWPWRKIWNRRPWQSSRRALRRPWRIRMKGIPTRLSSLCEALAALANKMEWQSAVEIAKGLAVVLENPQETDPNRLSSLSGALAAKIEPQ